MATFCRSCLAAGTSVRPNTTKPTSTSVACQLRKRPLSAAASTPSAARRTTTRPSTSLSCRLPVCSDSPRSCSASATPDHHLLSHLPSHLRQPRATRRPRQQVARGNRPQAQDTRPKIRASHTRSRRNRRLLKLMINWTLSKPTVP